MATLIVKRRSEWINRMRNLQLVLDGKPLGQIENGETRTFTIPAGKHTFKSTIDWTGSPEITLEVKEGETSTIEVKAFAGSKWLYRSALVGLPLFLVLLLFPQLAAQYAFLNYAAFLVMLPAFLLMFYRLSVGRNGYLELNVY